MRVKMVALIPLLAIGVSVAGDGKMPETTGDAVNVEFSIMNAGGIPAQGFRQGETVRFVFRVHNTGAEALRLAYTFPPHDIAVSKDANPVWQAWFGKMFQQVMRAQDLPPGESVKFFIEWNLESNDGVAVPPGNYRVEAGFNAFIQPGDGQLSLDAPPMNIIVIEKGDLQ